MISCLNPACFHTHSISHAGHPVTPLYLNSLEASQYKTAPSLYFEMIAPVPMADQADLATRIRHQGDVPEFFRRGRAPRLFRHNRTSGRKQCSRPMGSAKRRERDQATRGDGSGNGRRSVREGVGGEKEGRILA
jgi:hypothetical protein